MSQLKVIKRGEWLFKEGEKITHLFWVQSGSINTCLIRNKKTLEMQTLGANHILGETGLQGQLNHSYSAFCAQETKVLEVPIDLLKAGIDATPQPVKVLVKSLLDRLKLANNEIKNSRLEKDSSPLPEDQVARAFGALFHSLKIRGKEDKEGVWETDWLSLKQYAQRIFGESPKRLEQLVMLLVKMKKAEMIYGKPPENPDGPDELQTIRFHSPQYIEDFFEFYQYYYFKGGKTELLKVEEFCQQMLELFIEAAAPVNADRFGVVNIEFVHLTEFFKSRGINLNNDHFSRLEQKGVYSKRTQIAGVVYVQFEIKEYQKIQNNWRILREIEKWNEKGLVDMDEKEVKAGGKKGEFCPGCAAPITIQQKFCAECGYKLALAS